MSFPTSFKDVTVSRAIPAPPEKIFDVWIDPSKPGSLWHGVARLILHPVPDGLFYHLVEFEGKSWPHYGRFTRVDRASLLEHTWVSEATYGVETTVRVTFQPSAAGTEVTLRHLGIPEDMAARHEQGWTWLLSAVAEHL